MSERERVLFRTGDDGFTVGPVVDDHHLARVRALFPDEAFAHGLAQRDDAVRGPEEEAIDSVEQQVQDLAPELIQQPGDLGKDVLAHEDEPGVRATRRQERGQPDDRRVSQCDDDVGTRNPKRSHAGAEEIAEVVRSASREAPRPERGAPYADDLDPVVQLSRAWLPPRRTPSAFSPRAVQRGTSHDPHLVAARTNQILGQLGQELPRRAKIRGGGAVKEKDSHTVTPLSESLWL